ncbi:tetratricopeptide repeat protein [Streptomyces sp. G-G2]|uniref:tetratricopeptide repeat protein n=1 Tax=Streptomyces sp. G-G2 TaxID=3046201 RepID=UPI0024B87FC7|nr:tetratricopeptide repeat protein [Streptomyces sp. G-G2]MDJ0383111.1 tetratricopeptide repeat protein [Streptomyces sp. G-G2]
MSAEPPARAEHPEAAEGADPTALERGEALHDLGRFEQAAAVVGAYLAQRPEDPRALVVLARCRRALGDLPGALRSADEALRCGPDDVSARLVRTDVLTTLGRFPEAEQSARHGVELAPLFWGVHYSLAVVLERGGQRGRRGEAYDAARRATELGPDVASAHFMVGLLAHRLGDRVTAELAYETSLSLDPESSEAHNNLATLHLRRSWFSRSAWTRAAEGFVASAALDLEDRHARYNLEAMAWGIAAGARWPALVGFVLSVGTRAPEGTSATERAVATVLGSVLLLGLWAGWALWQRGRISPRLRRPMLLTARSCPPVIAMAAVVALTALYAVVVIALPMLAAGVVGGLGAPLIVGLVLTYWITRTALGRRSPDRRPA